MTKNRTEYVSKQDVKGTWDHIKFWVGLVLGIVLGAVAVNWYWVETTCQAGEMCL